MIVVFILKKSLLYYSNINIIIIMTKILKIKLYYDSNKFHRKKKHASLKKYVFQKSF